MVSVAKLQGTGVEAGTGEACEEWTGAFVGKL